MRQATITVLMWASTFTIWFYTSWPLAKALWVASRDGWLSKDEYISILASHGPDMVRVPFVDAIDRKITNLSGTTDKAQLRQL